MSVWSKPRSLVGLLLELGTAVRESNIEFFGSLNDGLSKIRMVRGMQTQQSHLPGLGGDGAANLSAVGSVVHKQQLDVLLTADKQFSESIGEYVASLLV